MLPSDDRLTRRAIGGDKRAFAAIFKRYQEPLYRYCLTIVGNRPDAEDALQSTMLKALNALPGEERRIELKPWLYRIAHNEAIGLIRRRRPSAPLDPELAGQGAGLAEETSQRQRLRQLLDDLEQLPERQRGALLMRELGGLSFEEIAAAFATSPATARQTLYEARVGLREMDAGRQMGCDQVSRAISDADGRVLRRRDVRAHLRSCEACSRFGEEIAGREHDLAALSPLPAVAAAGLLQGVLGAGGGASGGGAALGAGAAKAIGTSAVLKGTATVAVVAAIGVTAADRGGLIHVGASGDASSRSQSQQTARGGDEGKPVSGGSASPQPASAASPASAQAAPPEGDEKASRGAVEAQTNAASIAAEPSTEQPPPASPSSHGGSATAHEAGGHGERASAGHSTHPAKSAHPTHPGHPSKPAHPAKHPHPAKPEHPASSAKETPHPENPPHPDHPIRPSPSGSSPQPPAGEEIEAGPKKEGSEPAEVEGKP